MSTISREIKRNTGDRGYRYKQADAKAIERRKNTSSSPKKLTPANVAVIEEKLLNDWSPEQISGRLEIEGIVNISHETIYQHIWKDKRSGGTLYKHLRHNGKKYNKRSSGKAGILLSVLKSLRRSLVLAIGRATLSLVLSVKQQF